LHPTPLSVDKIRAILARRFGWMVFPIYIAARVKRKALGRTFLPVSPTSM
jgi:hypothetical protein